MQKVGRQGLLEPLAMIMMSLLVLANTYLYVTVYGPSHSSTKVLKQLEIEREEKAAYTIEWVLDAETKKGTVKTIQKGEDGSIRKKYLVKYENGVEKDSQLVSEIVLRQMQPEILSIGIKDTIVITDNDLERPKEVLNLQATAYTHTGNTTFTGVYPDVGTIAVDPKVIPLGTKMWVENYGYGIAQDTGGVIKGNIIDLFMDTEQECWNWGRRDVKVYILE